jgi:hypothetical protein
VNIIVPSSSYEQGLARDIWLERHGLHHFYIYPRSLSIKRLDGDYYVICRGNVPTLQYKISPDRCTSKRYIVLRKYYIFNSVHWNSVTKI